MISRYCAIVAASSGVMGSTRRLRSRWERKKVGFEDLKITTFSGVGASRTYTRKSWRSDISSASTRLRGGCWKVTVVMLGAWLKARVPYLDDGGA